MEVLGNLDIQGDGYVDSSLTVGGLSGGAEQIISVDINGRLQLTGSTIADVQGGGGVSVHSDLAGLQGGTTSEYFHLTENQHSILISGGLADSLHTHAGGGGSGITVHNDLTGKQGGTTDEYYHLTQNQESKLTSGGYADSQHLHDPAFLTTNVVLNGGFEEGTTTNADNWTQHSSYERVSTLPKDGAWSLAHTGNGSVQTASQAITIQPYTRYIVRAWVYIDSAGGGATTIAMDANDIDGEFTINFSAATEDIWQMAEEEWDSRENTSVTLRLLTNAVSGQLIYWDNVSIIPIGPGLSYKRYFFQADMLENPNNSDWTVNALAPAVADSNNNGLLARLFDDTTEEGVGFTVPIPIGATNIILDLYSRAETAATGNVVPKIYVREIPDNAVVESWSAGTNLTAIAMTSTEYFQYDTQTIALSTLSLVAGRIAQFELTRVGTDASDTLTGDWTLLAIKVSFT